MNDDLEQVQKFIFDDNIQNTLSSLNANLMDFNILEITGMGNQEIKHSNILGWLLSNSEHNFEYQILENFLKKVIEENQQDELNDESLNTLQSYIYLAENNKDITIYREKDNIDLLIVDEANKVVITIENKVYASERKVGKDGGQLQKYETIIKQKYNNSFKKYFIFLTINLEEASAGNEYWMRANHQMITNVIENILTRKEDITVKTKIILESYTDLLKRNGIVEDKILENLCHKIWSKPENKKALEILFNYKPDNFSKISEYIQEKLNNNQVDIDDSSKKYIRFTDRRWTAKSQKMGVSWTSNNNVLLYEFQNGVNGLFLKLIIGPSENTEFRKQLFNIAQENEILNPGNTLKTKWNQIWKQPFLSKEAVNEKSFQELSKDLDEKLDRFFTAEGSYQKINEVLSTIMAEN